MTRCQPQGLSPVYRAVLTLRRRGYCVQQSGRMHIIDRERFTDDRGLVRLAAGIVIFHSLSRTGPAKKRPPPRVRPLAFEIYDLIAEQPRDAPDLPITEMAQSLGARYANVRAALFRLAKRGIIQRIGRGIYRMPVALPPKRLVLDKGLAEVCHAYAVAFDTYLQMLFEGDAEAARMAALAVADTVREFRRKGET